MSPRSDYFISGSLDGTVRVWDLQSNICQGLLRLNSENNNNKNNITKSSIGNSVACAFDPEGLVFAVALGNNQIKLFDLRSLDQVFFFCLFEYLFIYYYLFLFIYFDYLLIFNFNSI